MKRSAVTLLTMALAAGLAAADGGKIQWRQGKDHDAALAEARATGVPIVIYFSGSS